MASKINLIPIELDDGSANSPNLENSNRIVVYVPKATETTYGIVTLKQIDDSIDAAITAHDNDADAHDDLFALKQDKTDNSLNTTSKTVVGAINELDERIDNEDANVDAKITAHNQADDAHSDIRATLAGKQDTLTFDNVPTQSSSNPVKSGGVYTSLANINLAAVGSIAMSINSSTYVVTLQAKNLNGENVGTAQTIDLPLESVVVSGSYDDTTKKVVLTLENGNTVEFSVADLVSGLQSEITVDNKLSADLVDDTLTTNQFVTATDKTTWNGKQDALTAGTHVDITNDVISVSGIYSLITGTGAPTTQGIDNDCYIDLSTYDFYRKESGVWVLKGNIEGSDGSDGETPYIGVNDNWWIGNVDTGVLAQGQNGVGVPAGGTTGQILAKKSNTDYDTEWKTNNAVTLDATVQSFTGEKQLNFNAGNLRIKNTSNNTHILISAYQPFVRAFVTNYQQATYKSDGITHSSSDYKLSFPYKTGTIALTSDVQELDQRCWNSFIAKSDLNPASNSWVKEEIWAVLYTTTRNPIYYIVEGGALDGDMWAVEGRTSELIIIPDIGYELPSSITVTNATSNYDALTGRIQITNPTGDVTVTAVCPEV